MRIIAYSRLLEYGRKYGPDADSRLRAWYQEARAAEWRSPQDIRDRFKDADFIGDEVVIFDICQNRFRLIVKVWYAGQEIYIKLFGTHAEYDRFDLEGLRDEHR